MAEHKAEKITINGCSIEMLRGGTGEQLLFLHGAGGIKEWSPYLDALAGRVDLLLADAVALQAGFLSTDTGKEWTFVGPSYTEPEYFGEGSGVAVRKGDTKLVGQFNRAIAAIRRNGVYKAINDKYFDFDLYGD